MKAFPSSRVRGAGPLLPKKVALLLCLATLSGSVLADAIGPVSAKDRAEQAYKLRKEIAKRNFELVLPAHPDNGDEAAYASRLNSYTKGLPHDALGLVRADAYTSLLSALSTGRNADFEAIPLGVPNGIKLRNPQHAYTFQLEGRDTHALTMRAAPSFSSAEQASEAAEVMWQALTRDVPFSQYSVNTMTVEAAADMSRFSDFRGPKAGGVVTATTLFRGNTNGDLAGPYISQFLYKPVPFGAQPSLVQKFTVPVAGNDHLTNYAEWLNVQNGGKASGITAETFDPTPRYIRNNRDLAQYVLRDFIYQPYLAAARILGGFGPGAVKANPYVTSASQTVDPLWGVNHVLDMVGRVANASQGAAWYQKWLVHRRARPEVFFGRVHSQKLGMASYPLNPELLASSSLARVYERNGTYLLPTAGATGSPLHPSYPAGHATMAGAGVTVLKAFFNGSFVIPSPVVASDDGLSLVPYSGAPLTVEGELNKLANNISFGRDAAGVHYRSDNETGILLGEEMAISILQDLVETYTDDFSGFTFNRFDGTPVVIRKTWTPTN